MFESVCLLVDGKIRLLNTVKVLWIHEWNKPSSVKETFVIKLLTKSLL